MASVLSYLRELNIVTMMLRIVLAVLCSLASASSPVTSRI